jgi:hypothetical protein
MRENLDGGLGFVVGVLVDDRVDRPGLEERAAGGGELVGDDDGRKAPAEAVERGGDGAVSGEDDIDVGDLRPPRDRVAKQRAGAVAAVARLDQIAQFTSTTAFITSR